MKEDKWKFIKCPVCNEYHFKGDKCKKRYQFQIPEFYGDEEWYDIRADSFEKAAERACELDDARGDFTIIGRGSLDEIFVRDPETDEVKKFCVEAEGVPTYYAKEIK